MTFDAFISYSHAADSRLASALQRAIQTYAKPIYRIRASRVFRDETTLSLTPELWPEIQRAIEGSRYFILMANPQAASSEWVQKEVSYWLELGRADRLLLVWTGGRLSWDNKAGDFDWIQTDALPRQLRGVLSQEPFYLDLRWAKQEAELTLAHKEFGRAVAQLTAPIRGMSLDEIFGEDVRQHRRNRLIAGAGITSLLIMALFAGWRWYQELQARTLAEKRRIEAETQRAIAEQEKQVAQTRLAQTLHERGLLESEEHGKPSAALLLASQASAAAPEVDRSRSFYRLRTLYLALDEPQEVHQLGHQIDWAIMPPSEHLVTFSQLPFLEVWSTKTWKKTRMLNVDPRKLPVTGVSPYVTLPDGHLIEVVAHEAVDQENTRGSGWNNFQQWDLETGLIRRSEREVSYRSYVGWIFSGLPCRNAVSISELETLCQAHPHFRDVVHELSRQKLDPLKVDRAGKPDVSSAKFWWVDAISAAGNAVLASFYDHEHRVPWNGTWNGAAEPVNDNEGAIVAIWQWANGTYTRRWTVKEEWQKQFPQAAGFGLSGGGTVVWSISQNGTLNIADADHGAIVRPPIWLQSKAWVRIANGEPTLWIVDAGGRVAIDDLRWDDGASSSLTPQPELAPANALMSGDNFAVTATGYWPAPGFQREIALWQLGTGRAEWKYSQRDHHDFNLEEAPGLALSPSRQRVAAQVRLNQSRELWIWDRNKSRENPVLSHSSLHEIPNCLLDISYPVPHVQFRGEDRVVWTDCRKVQKTKIVRLNQGFQTVPAEPIWTVRTASLQSARLQPIDVGRMIAPNERFLAFSKDGGAFLSSADGMLIARSTDIPQSGIKLRSTTPDFADLAPLFFQSATDWHAEGSNAVGQLSSGTKLILSGGSIDIQRGGERWTVRDPRNTPSVENLLWDISNQQLIAVSPSGRIIVTVSAKPDVKGVNPKALVRGNLLRLWNTATGAPISSWLWHDSEIIAAAFAGDGWLCSLTKNGQIRKWPGDTAELAGSNWLDAIGEPVSGLRLNQLSKLQPIDETELASIRRRLREQLQHAVLNGNRPAQWYLRRLRGSN